MSFMIFRTTLTTHMLDMLFCSFHKVELKCFAHFLAGGLDALVSHTNVFVFRLSVTLLN